jgi:phospholipid-binding lipoprotein MlaA
MDMLNRLATIAFATLLTGCASTSAPTADPLMDLNRATFAFNDAADRTVLKPIAQGFKALAPEFVRGGLANVFSNLADVPVGINNLLQGKPRDALSDAGRVLINSTLGVLGLFDVATPMGLDRHDEDFGQTLGTYGVGPGPYLVIPFLGPSTLRDAFGRGVDAQAGWSKQVEHVRSRNAAAALELVNVRAGLLGASETLEQAALDKYQFLRDAYLQRRLRLVHDGKLSAAQLDQLDEDLAPPPAAKAK